MNLGRSVNYSMVVDARELNSVAIPNTLTHISASVAHVGNLKYITGISLTTSTGETVRLGYRNSSERSVQLSGELAGFNVAVGLGGIHALQCINRETRESIPWLGCPDDVPRTERLSLGTRIIALEAGFDVGTPYILILTFCLLTLGSG